MQSGAKAGLPLAPDGRDGASQTKPPMSHHASAGAPVRPSLALLALAVGLILYNVDQNLAARGLPVVRFPEPSRRLRHSDPGYRVLAARHLRGRGTRRHREHPRRFRARRRDCHDSRLPGGAALLSPNLLLAPAALAIVELIRNTPQLLQILFIYTVILRALPAARDSLSLGGLVFLNVRGLFLPAIRPIRAHRCRGFCSLRTCGSFCRRSGSAPSSSRWAGADVSSSQRLRRAASASRLPLRDGRAAA